MLALTTGEVRADYAALNIGGIPTLQYRTTKYADHYVGPITASLDPNQIGSFYATCLDSSATLVTDWQDGRHAIAYNTLTALKVVFVIHKVLVAK